MWEAPFVFDFEKGSPPEAAPSNNKPKPVVGKAYSEF
jgi:hypothetical protein